MKLQIKRIGLACAGMLFALTTVWIHYEVKAKLEPAVALAAGGSLAKTSYFDTGEIMPDFLAIGLDCETVTLSEFRGRETVMLDFWATWCVPCIAGFPELQQLHEELGEEGLEILAVNVGERVDTVQDFMESEGYSFRVVLDPDKEIKKLYGVDGIPQLIVVDNDGKPRHIEVGYPMSERGAEQRKKRIRKLLEKLLEQAPTATSEA